MSDSQFLDVTTTPNASIQEGIGWFHLHLIIENQHHLNFRLILAPTLDLEGVQGGYYRHELDGSMEEGLEEGDEWTSEVAEV